MAADLRERLDDLAREPRPSTAPPDLWARGRRRRRRGQVGTALTAVVAAVLLAAGVTAWRESSSHLAPADTHGTVHLPDRLFAPSPWLPAFSGPPGRLVATIQASRKSFWHSQPGVVGVSATSGDYGFLDLPRVSDLDQLDPALSPDGRYLAYWARGRTGGEPSLAYRDPVVGLTVYDCLTGRTSTARFGTRHGLEPGGLLWVDDHTVAFGYDQLLNTSARRVQAAPGRGLVWSVGAPHPVALPSGQDNLADADALGSGRLLMPDATRRGHVLVTPATGTVRRVRISGVRHPRTMVASAGNTTFAGTTTSTWSVKGSLLTGRLVPDSRRGTSDLRLHRMPGTPGSVSVLGWADRHRIAVVRAHTSGTIVTARLDLVDVRTGASSTLVSGIPDDGSTTQLATDLLSAPTAHASPPPAPWGPRVTLLVVLVVAGLAGFVLWWIRGYRRE